MANVTIPSLVDNFLKAFSTDSTRSSFAAVLPAILRPATVTAAATAVRAYDRGKPGLRDQNVMVVVPFGGNDDNDAFSIKILGWNFQKGVAAGAKGLWIPQVVCEIACTLSAALTGVAGEDMPVTQFFSDTLVTTKGLVCLHQGTGDIDVAWFEVSVAGFEVVTLTTADKTTSNAQNAWVRFDTGVKNIPVGLGT